MPPSVDAVVIGAGVIGCSVAFELARSGRSVVCVDKGPAPGAGSTSSSSSIIRFSYSTLDAVLTSWEAAALWQDWRAHLGGDDPDGLATFVSTGSLILCGSGYDAAAVTSLWDDVGIPYERLSTDDLRRRFPAIDPGEHWPPKRIDDPAFGDDPTGELSAVYEPSAGYIDDPMLAARNLAAAAHRQGASFRFRAAVVEVQRRSGRVSGVRLDGGDTIAAPVVVNVGGPHARRINELAGVTADMRIGHRPLRQEVFVAPAPAAFALAARAAPMVADLDLGQYFRPQRGGTVLVGSTEPECDPLEWIDDPDDFRETTTPLIAQTAMLRLARRLQGFGVPARPAGLAALYDASDDWVPIYDRSSLPGFFMACGTSGNQFKNAPMAGRFLAALVDAADAGVDHDHEPVRVVGSRTGRPIDLGAFSRLRSPSATTGTVMG